MLTTQHYTNLIDIWSIGCIFAELMNKQTLFPGQSHFMQLEMILNVLGYPSDEDLAFISHS